MKKLNITSHHSSLLAAVKAAGIDLSYNEPLALADIASLEKGSAGFIKLAPVNEAFVTTENGESAVYYVMNCDLPLLNKFTPFHGCLNDGKFSIASFDGNASIFITEGITSDRKKIAAAIKNTTGPGRLLACKL